MIAVRVATEKDAKAIGEVFRMTYGDDYCYPQFFDPESLKRLIFADDTLMLVAEDTSVGKVVGTSSVLLEKGAYTDLVGEFGRLAVHPDFRRKGIGKMLMNERITRVKDWLHVGVIDSRVVHPYSAQIASANGFAAVGYIPGKLQMTMRENVGLMAQFFQDALRLRRNHPKIIPEAYQLAALAMENCGLECDVTVDADAASYPHCDEFTFEELTTKGYTSLLRIERGRLKNREIFGPLRLQYGFFKLQAKNSHYLLAHEKGKLVGAVGYTLDEIDRVVRIFELITVDDRVVRFLIDKLLAGCVDEWGALNIEADVSAYSPRMQRTLLEFGFLPSGYIPALVFHDVERLDVLKMTKLMVPIEYEQDLLTPELQGIANIVRRSFECRQIQPQVMDALGQVELFSGLNEEQQKTAATYFSLEEFAQGEEIFRASTPSDKLYIVLSGGVDIYLPGQDSAIGSVSAGECLGEVGALSGVDHSATAQAKSKVELAVMSTSDLTEMIRLRPGIGVVLFRNLAIGLGNKLRRSDLALISDSSSEEVE